MRVLTLNKSWIPIRTTSHYSAISRFYSGACEAIYIKDGNFEVKEFDEWMEMSLLDIWPEDQKFIEAVRQRIAIPKVVKCTTYDKIPKASVRLNRRNIYDRDDHTCYLCNKRFGEGRLSVDHIIPVSKGGKTEWTNVITCCRACNYKKGDKLLGDLGLKPHFEAYRPSLSNMQKLKSSLTSYQKEWALFGI